MQASLAIQVSPKVIETDKVIAIVDEVIAFIKSTGLSVHVGPFETTIEGDDLDYLFDIAKQCQKIAIRAGAPQVISYIKVAYSPEGVLSTDEKITKHQ